MYVYWFSRSAPSPQMVQELGGAIAAQFKGRISDIHSRFNQIIFTETLCMGGREIKCRHLIPAESVVVADQASLLVQETWLKAGVAVLLVPQTYQEKTDEGKQVPKYGGLLRINEIKVVTSQWAGSNSTRWEAGTARWTNNPPASQKAQESVMLQVKALN